MMIPILFSYLLKLNVGLGIVYLFYCLVLQDLTFYKWIRYYLLSFTALSFLIPLVDISVIWEVARQAPLPTVTHYMYPVESITGSGLKRLEVVNSALDVWDWLLILMLIGVCILLVRTAVQFISFVRIRRAGHLISHETIKIYQVNANILPFSFGQSIFLNRALHPKEDLAEIIRHELVHVQQGHTADIIWMELICILNWYNPFTWLLRQKLRQNLEFIADNKVLQSGSDKKHYQYLLLQVTGTPAFNLANQFNYSTLKKRIVMMNKMPSTRPELVKFLFLLPVVAVLLFSFRSVNPASAMKVNLPLSLINGAGLKNYDLDDLKQQKEPKNLVNWKTEENSIVVAYFQDGTQEQYNLATEAGKQKMQAALLYMGDAYKPEDLTRKWPEDFPDFLTRNPQVAKLKWRYDIEQIRAQIKENDLFYPADRLYLTLKSGVEEVYTIENKEDLANMENKFGKLPMLPPPPPALKL